MKKIVNLLFLLSCIHVLDCCNLKEKNQGKQDKNIVKIITTRAYVTKHNFDSFLIDKPEYNLGYDETLGMDFKWTVKYLDIYDNLVKLQRLKQDSSGKEDIFESTVYEYSDPRKGLLKFENTTGDYSNENKTYVRNEKGQLQQLVESHHNEITTKTAYEYNSSGKISKKTIYRKEGIDEIFQYQIQHKPDSSFLVKEIRESFSLANVVETIQLYSKDKRCIKSTIQKTENGKLTSNIIYKFLDFIGDIPTIEICEGFSPPIKIYNADGTFEVYPSDPSSKPFRKTTKIYLNQHKHIVRYEMSYLDSDELKSSSNPATLGSRHTVIYTCDYTYNEKGDCVRVILSTDGEKYFIEREIQYIK